MEFINILSKQFYQEALFGAIIVSILTSTIGVFTTLKKESFIPDALAHASLAGVALALLFSTQPLWLALFVGVSMAIGITYIEKKTSISADAVIGIFFSVLMALGIVIFYSIPGFKTSLTSYLFGSIYSIQSADLYLIYGIFSTFILFLSINYEKLIFIAFDPDSAFVKGIKVRKLEYLLRIFTALIVIASIKIVGVVLISALIIIPASTARLFAKKFKQMIPFSITFSLIGTITGIVGNYYLQTPPGPTIVLFLGSIFFLSWISKSLVHKFKPNNNG